MKKHLLTAAMALGAMVLAVSGAQAKYVFALVPKNMNNPFFDQARDGCKKAEAESNGAFECMYIGPGEHGGGDEQVTIVQDLVAKKVDGIAVSPSNAAAMAVALQAAKDAGIPVLTWDSDLLPENKDLRVAYIGTHNYEIGTNLAKLAMAIKPKGGTVCIQSGGAAAANHNERMQGIRDTLSGTKSAASPGDQLTGQNGWTEIEGCPLYTDDDFPRSVQQFEDIMAKNPNLDAFIPTGGFPQFIPDANRAAVGPYKDKIASKALALVVADTLARSDRPDEGRPVARPGRPAAVRDGLQDDDGTEGHEGRQGSAGRPDLYRPRRLHAGDSGYLHRQIEASCMRKRAGGNSRPFDCRGVDVGFVFAQGPRRIGDRCFAWPRLRHGKGTCGKWRDGDRQCPRQSRPLRGGEKDRRRSSAVRCH